MLHMPTPMLLGGEAATPYQLYQAHIRQRATGGSAGWSSFKTSAGSYYTTAGGAEGGGMIGSSWAAYVYEVSSTIQRVVLHGLPDRATFLAILAAGTDVFFRTESAGLTDNFEPRDRNGYYSLSSNDVPGTYEAHRLRELVWWTGSEALTSDPFGGSPPSTYTVP